MQHRVVDRGAQHLAERAGAERGVVVDVAGLRAAVPDHLVRQFVELEQVHSDVGARPSAVRTSATNRPAGRICSISVGVRYSITLRFCRTPQPASGSCAGWKGLSSSRLAVNR